MLNNEDKDPQKIKQLLQSVGNIKMSIHSIHFVALNKQDSSYYSAEVYALNGEDVSSMQQQIKAIEKAYEGRTQTLEDFLNDV